MPRKGSKKNSKKGGKKPAAKAASPVVAPVVAEPVAEPVVVAAGPAAALIAKPAVAKHPMVKWAETTDAIFLTLEVSDCVAPDIQFSDGSVCFMGTNKDGVYYCDLRLKAEIDSSSEDTKWTCTGRDIQMHLVKKEADRWNGLLADRNLGRNVVKPDFDKWVDSDDEEKDAGGFDQSQFGGGPPGMGGMGGPPGMGGMGGMGGMMGGMGGGGGGMGGMADMMGGMGGMGGGGPGGMEGMDMAKMMEMMKGMGGGEGGADGVDGDDEDDDDDLPDLEDAEEAK